MKFSHLLLICLMSFSAGQLLAMQPEMPMDQQAEDKGCGCGGSQPAPAPQPQDPQPSQQ